MRKIDKTGKAGHIIKRHGRVEAFDERKVYASVYAAALNCHYGEQKAEALARQVTRHIASWVKRRKGVDSRDIREEILACLTDTHVALMYRHHLDIC